MNPIKAFIISFIILCMILPDMESKGSVACIIAIGIGYLTKIVEEGI